MRFCGPGHLFLSQQARAAQLNGDELGGGVGNVQKSACPWPALWTLCLESVSDLRTPAPPPAPLPAGHREPPGAEAQRHINVGCFMLFRCTKPETSLTFENSATISMINGTRNSFPSRNPTTGKTNQAWILWCYVFVSRSMDYAVHSQGYFRVRFANLDTLSQEETTQRATPRQTAQHQETSTVP